MSATPAEQITDNYMTLEQSINQEKARVRELLARNDHPDHPLYCWMRGAVNEKNRRYPHCHRLQPGPLAGGDLEDHIMGVTPILTLWPDMLAQWNILQSAVGKEVRCILLQTSWDLNDNEQSEIQEVDAHITAIGVESHDYVEGFTEELFQESESIVLTVAFSGAEDGIPNRYALDATFFEGRVRSRTPGHNLLRIQCDGWQIYPLEAYCKRFETLTRRKNGEPEIDLRVYTNNKG